MADFVAVLKKTLDGLGETSPEMREKVYGKARATIAAKLASIQPAPPAAVVDRQKRALEDAIVSVEHEFAAKVAVPAAPFDVYDDDFSSRPEFDAVEPADAGLRDEVGLSPDERENAEDRGDSFADAGMPAPRRRRPWGRLFAACVALLALAGAGYAAWVYQEDVLRVADTARTALLGEAPEPEPVAEAKPKKPARKRPPRNKAAAPEQEVASAPAEPTAEPAPAPAAPTEAAAPAEVAAPAAEASAPMASPPAEAQEAPKFTQRLNADGTEIDAGRAVQTPTVGEGTSVAAATLPAIAAAQAAEAPAEGLVAQAPAVAPTSPTPEAPPAPATPHAAGPSPAPAATPAAAPATVPVGQRAIFYEERTNVASGSAETGGIVWSLIQESPGGDLPPEPAIRAEATIPGKDLQLRMTIKRNGDDTLPASHIVELIFLTPEGFEGGGIDNVLRIALKASEEDAGSPLNGIPAKIADGFFLFALNDAKPDVDANTTLLGARSWIDVPIVYKSGRRALFTMEKGIPGDKVFEEALKAWGGASSG